MGQYIQSEVLDWEWGKLFLLADIDKKEETERALVQFVRIGS